jgi:hypothetical protein
VVVPVLSATLLNMVQQLHLGFLILLAVLQTVMLDKP